VRRKGSGRKRAFGAVDAGKYLAAAAGSLFLAWQVVKTSAVDAYVRTNLPAAAAISSDHPRVRMAIAMAEFRARGGKLSEPVRAMALAGLADAPLTEEPFFLEAVRALAAGENERGLRLLHEARRRDPRARTHRLILLDRHLRAKDVAAAGAEIAVINRLIPRSGEVLVPELARMVRNPATGAALVQVLGREPRLQQAVLERLASSGADPDLILRVAASNASTRGTPEGLPWQGALLNRLVEKGEFGRAYALWRSFSGLGAGAGEKGVYDGGFAGAPGAPPFNWFLGTGAEGVAERTKQPALQVEYYGRAGAELARQLLLLRPGRHRLQFRAAGSANGQGSHVAWTIECAGSKSQILGLPLRDIGEAGRNIAAEFTVPAGCAGQWLRLKGQAGEFPETQSLTITDVAISKVSG
jgi:hypothetical protein